MQVIGISYDSVEVLKEFAAKRNVTFPLLSDPASQTIIAYSLKNQEMDGKSFGRVHLEGVPYPGTLLVDQAGVIRAKLFLKGYKDRHSVEELLKAAATLQAD